MRGTLYIVAAPSGAGKSSIVNAVLARDHNISLSISFTSRQPRPGERHAEHYHFISADEFEAMVAAGDFFEHARAALETRMRKRGQDSEEVIAQRLAAARDEMSHYGEFDYVIVNEDFETAVGEMCSIFTASRLRKDAQVARHARLITSLLVDE